MTDRARFVLLIVILVAGGAVINLWEMSGEAAVSRRQLSEFPTAIGPWSRTGPDIRFDKETEAVLRADDYLSRNYSRPDGATASFYVGYYASQRTGATYHSPLNCLPGSGWEMSNPSRILIEPAGGGGAFEANSYVIRNGGDRYALIYWYQGRGRAVASEYWGKIYTVIDSARLRRSDGSMVRVMAPLGASEEMSLATARDLAARVAPVLPEFVPN